MQARLGTMSRQAREDLSRKLLSFWLSELEVVNEKDEEGLEGGSETQRESPDWLIRRAQKKMVKNQC